MSKLLKIAMLSAATLAGASSFAAAQYADDGYYYNNPRECAPGTSGSYVPGPDGVPQCVQSNHND